MTDTNRGRMCIPHLAREVFHDVRTMALGSSTLCLLNESMKGNSKPIDRKKALRFEESRPSLDLRPCDLEAMTFRSRGLLATGAQKINHFPGNRTMQKEKPSVKYVRLERNKEPIWT